MKEEMQIEIGSVEDVGYEWLVRRLLYGMTQGFSPKFLRRYADLHTIMTDAIGNYVSDVKNSDFPNEDEQY